MTQTDVKPALTLPDGTVVYSNGSTKKPLAKLAERIVTGTEAKQAIQRMRLSVSDLPMAAREANPLVAIITYMMLGMTDADINYAFGLKDGQLDRMRSNPQFIELQDLITKNVYEVERDRATAVLSKAQLRASNVLVDALDDEVLSFAAAKEVLDRTGIHSGAKNIGNNGGKTLTIRIVDGDAVKDRIELEIGA